MCYQWAESGPSHTGHAESTENENGRGTTREGLRSGASRSSRTKWMKPLTVTITWNHQLGSVFRARRTNNEVYHISSFHKFVTKSCFSRIGQRNKTEKGNVCCLSIKSNRACTITRKRKYYKDNYHYLQERVESDGRRYKRPSLLCAGGCFSGLVLVWSLWITRVG